MSRYNYSDSEKDILKVQKMQEEQLKTLEESIQTETNELLAIRKRIEILAKKRGVEIPTDDKITITTNNEDKIDCCNIPSWEECSDEANRIIHKEIIIEDLLDKEEFQFCIDEVNN